MTSQLQYCISFALKVPIDIEGYRKALKEIHTQISKATYDTLDKVNTIYVC